MATLFESEYKKVQSDLNRPNVHSIPRLKEIVINVGVGKNRDNKQYLEAVQHDLSLISGQRPQERLARKAIAGFNVRQSNVVAYRVTLHGSRMEDFMQRFVHVTLPRVRDFRGISPKAFDGHGNLSVGLREQLPFPEIQPEETDVIFGVQVTLVTTAMSDEEATVLLRAFRFPLTE